MILKIDTFKRITSVYEFSDINLFIDDTRSILILKRKICKLVLNVCKLLILE